MAAPSESVDMAIGATDITLVLTVTIPIGHLCTGTAEAYGAETMLLKFWFESMLRSSVPALGRGALPGLMKRR